MAFSIQYDEAMSLSLDDLFSEAELEDLKRKWGFVRTKSYSSVINDHFWKLLATEENQWDE